MIRFREEIILYCILKGCQAKKDNVNERKIKILLLLFRESKRKSGATHGAGLNVKMSTKIQTKYWRYELEDLWLQIFAKRSHGFRTCNVLSNMLANIVLRWLSYANQLSRCCDLSSLGHIMLYRYGLN